MRLVFSNLLRSEEFEAIEAVCGSTFQKQVQARNFLLLGRHDNLAAQLEGNAMLRTEFNHSSNSLHRKASFLRSGLVIKSAVQDPTVVPSLVLRWARLLF